MTGHPASGREDRILIVGGGIAGLSLALALRRQGLTAEIIERAPGWAASGTGLYLVGAAVRALGSLGLADAALGQGAAIDAQIFHDARGRRLAHVDVREYWRSCGPCLGISRAAVHRILSERVTGLPVRFGTSVAALREEAHGVVVRFTDGSIESYDLVVGADGIRSTVRRLTLGESEPRFRGQIGWRFVAAAPTSVPLDGWTVYLGPGSAFLFVPIARDAVYCYADRSAPAPDADASTWDITRLRAQFADFAPVVREVLDVLDQPGSADTVYQSPIEETPELAWGRGRVILIGDAAHAMSPNMACGAAMALEDATVLAEIIARPDPLTSVLPELVRRRSARVRWVWRQTNQRDRLRRLPSGVRNFMVRRFADRTYQANYRPLLAPP